jgi:NAD(P)-dependent dehydrogenase (short-subunit alcohol dehydrogenase family)
MPEARRTALATGSGRNIGRGVLLELARLGFNVVAHGHRRRRWWLSLRTDDRLQRHRPDLSPRSRKWVSEGSIPADGIDLEAMRRRAPPCE